MGMILEQDDGEYGEIKDTVVPHVVLGVTIPDAGVRYDFASFLRRKKRYHDFISNVRSFNVYLDNDRDKLVVVLDLTKDLPPRYKAVTTSISPSYAPTGVECEANTILLLLWEEFCEQ